MQRLAPTLTVVSLLAVLLAACGQAPETVEDGAQEVATVYDTGTEPEAMAGSGAEAASSEDEPVTLTRESGVSLYAPGPFAQSDELAAVESAAAELAADGTTVCFELYDLATGYTLSLNADQVMYPASAIKALYCTSLYEKLGGSGGRTRNVESCLEWSSNDDYETLIDAYGMNVLADWLEGLGLGDAAANARLHFYPELTTANLVDAWREVYRYCSSDEAGAAELAGFLAQTNHTPIGETLRPSYTVWSKAGWFPQDENDLASTNDAGVVMSDSGAYVLAIMTDRPADLESLMPLVSALDAAHTAMCD